MLFSLVGVSARISGYEGAATLAMGRELGPAVLLLINFIMITSAASTLDSTFSSGAKLLAIDWGRKESATVRKGRIAMITTALAGTLPLLFSPEILSATTVSGTMVLGLAPVFIFWNKKMPPLSYYLSVGTGLIAGLWLAFYEVPATWIPFDGKYGDLLWINLWASTLCFALFFLPKLWTPNTSAL